MFELYSRTKRYYTILISRPLAQEETPRVSYREEEMNGERKAIRKCWQSWIGAMLAIKGGY